VRRDLFVDEVQDLFVLAAASASMRAPRLTCAGPVLNDDPHDKNVLMRADPHPAFQREQTAARSKICRQRTPCPSSRMLWQLLVRNSLKPWRGLAGTGPRSHPNATRATMLRPCSRPLLPVPNPADPVDYCCLPQPSHRPERPSTPCPCTGPSLLCSGTKPRRGRSFNAEPFRPALAASRAHELTM